MKTLLQILILILQLIAASLLGFALAVALGLGNGWELVVFVLGFSLGVWGVGALAARLNKTYQSRNQFIRLAAALLLSTLGVTIILITPAIGFIRILYPLVGAFLGYYLPDTGVMTLMDFVNLLGLVTIFLCMIQTVISSRIAATDKDFSRLFDKVSFGLIAFIYIGLNIALPLVARIH